MTVCVRVCVRVRVGVRVFVCGRIPGGRLLAESTTEVRPRRLMILKRSILISINHVLSVDLALLE